MMKKVLFYTSLLITGLILSQILPHALAEQYAAIARSIRILSMIGLSYIMIHVGLEFHIDKSRLKQYGWDYLVAFTAATFPWIFVTLYFMYVVLPPEFLSNIEAWKETLLAGRFAAPTSAGVLFSMLAAAGLSTTWVFKKARILAIFDDLDTVLLMIPLKILMIGVAWQLGFVAIYMFLLLLAAYVFLHQCRMHLSWPWTLGYATAIALISELIYAWTSLIDPSVPIHIEVLLPAFVLGCIARPMHASEKASIDEIEQDIHEMLDTRSEKMATTLVASAFMILVGLSMPLIMNAPMNDSYQASVPEHTMSVSAQEYQVHGKEYSRITATQPPLPWRTIIIHVLIVTILSNLGKMFPAFCYRKEAHWRERLAVAICMWPRGEVGAGVLVVSLSYGIGGPVVIIAMMALALNLILTGLFIVIIKQLLNYPRKALL